jgi:hypothetical protein
MPINYGSNDVSTTGIVDVDNLRLDGNTLSATNTNGNIIVQSNGTGALQRDSGGNARGQYAVDLQNVRSSSTMVAAGKYSVVGGGNNNTASNLYSTVSGGRGNNASGIYSTVSGGSSNNASSERSTVGGGLNNNASSYYSTVGGGIYNNASGPSSTVGGGLSNNASSSYSTVGGGRSNTASSIYSTVSGGGNNRATGSYSTVGGGGGGFQFDGNTASGNRSTVSGGMSNDASGSYSTVSGGNSNDASGSYSTVSGGTNNNASGSDSTVSGGRINNASGQYATVVGGIDGVASLYGEEARSSGKFNTSGDAQIRNFILRNKTSNNHIINLFLNGSSQEIVVPENSTWVYTIKIVGRSSSDTESAGYKIEGVMESSPLGTLLLSESKTVLAEDNANWDVDVSIDETGASPIFRITTTVESDQNDVSWVAYVEVVQVIVTASTPSY